MKRPTYSVSTSGFIANWPLASAVFTCCFCKLSNVFRSMRGTHSAALRLGCVALILPRASCAAKHSSNNFSLAQSAATNLANCVCVIWGFVQDLTVEPFV